MFIDTVSQFAEVDGQAEAPDEGCTSTIALRLVDDRIFISALPRTPNGKAAPASGLSDESATAYG